MESDKQFNEIERQLHEQYANNNNSYLGHIVTLVVGLFAVIGLYGNVFIKSNLLFEKAEDYEYTMGDLFIAAAFAYIALGIMAYLCIYLGMHQRHEQFVVWAIRKNFYGNKYNEPKIFYYNYIPFVDNSFALIKGLYGVFVKIISFVTLCITISMFLKLVLCICEIYDNGDSYSKVAMYIIPVAVHIFVYIICVLRFKRGEKKYQRLYDEYRSYYTSESKPIKPDSFEETPNKRYFQNFFITLSLFKIKNDSQCTA